MEKVQRWFTADEIQTICLALKTHKNMLNSHDLEYGSTYFMSQADQRERMFNKLIDRIQNGDIVHDIHT